MSNEKHTLKAKGMPNLGRGQGNYLLTFGKTVSLI
jgi:hypothetical protein